MSGLGALPCQAIRRLITHGSIVSNDPRLVRPASLDLSLSGEAYRVPAVFLPQKGETVRTMLERIRPVEHQLGRIMERGVTYLVRLEQSTGLPPDVYGYANPKSSTGRVNLHVRVLADGVPRYDTLPRGYDGELWLSVVPGSFPVIIRERETLSQMRFFTCDTRIGEAELAERLVSDKLLWRPDGRPIGVDDLYVRDGDGSLTLTLDFPKSQAGWRCSGTADVLDLGERERYDPADFFEPVHADRNGTLVLRKGSFYVLQAKEHVRVPSFLACEMRPMDERTGEFRSHQAGYIDPGWGWGEQGEGMGRPLTLEVVPFEDFLVYDGRPIAKIRFEEMAAKPDMLYDVTGTYKGQYVPLLSKHFMPEKQIQQTV